MGNNIEVLLAGGRQYLSVNGFVVAVEGDMCRDSELPGMHWSPELLETVASGTPRKTDARPSPFASLPAVNAEVEYRVQKLKARAAHDAWIAKHLKETYAVVKATHAEEYNLWAECSVENPFRTNCSHERQLVLWEHISRGFTETVGAVRFGHDVMPIIMSISWMRLRLRPSDAGRLVMFWEMCSQVTDSRMAERFIAENLPANVIRTTLWNFDELVQSLEE